MLFRSQRFIDGRLLTQLLLGIYRVQLEAVRLDFEEDRKQVSPIAFI